MFKLLLFNERVELGLFDKSLFHIKISTPYLGFDIRLLLFYPVLAWKNSRKDEINDFQYKITDIIVPWLFDLQYYVLTNI